MQGLFLEDLSVGQSADLVRTVGEADIIAFCRSHMSGFKTPKAVVFGPIPKTSTGKIQKFLLRNEVGSAKAISA